jgi:glycosyltransferase involved in cell wall biosynthesis
MRIDQVLPSFQTYDAISTDAWLLQKVIHQHNLEGDIFSELNTIRGVTHDFRKLKEKSSKDHIVIYHHSIGSMIPYFLHEIPALKIIRYHNITPSQFFRSFWSRNAYFRCNEGRIQLPILRSLSDSVWSTSRYNLAELQQFSFPRHQVLPVLRQYEALAQGEECKDTSALIRGRSCKNILFVGRVVPHKAHHDLFFYLAMYRKHYNRQVRLFCVGNESSYSHRQVLRQMATHLGLSVSFTASTTRDYQADIVFVSGVEERKLASFYRNADLFFNLSEHEGFCVPLVEAMFFGVPLLVQNAAASPETAGDSAILVEKSNPQKTLEAMDSLLGCGVTNQLYRQRSLARAENYRWDTLARAAGECLRSVIKLP